VLVLILALGTLTLIEGTSAGYGPGSSRATASGLASRLAVPLTCSEARLSHLFTTPASANVSPLEDQKFTVTALNACGTPLAQMPAFSWWLSSPSLGLLNSSSGPDVAYTACLAPMDGILHVAATSGGLTFYANSSITVSLQNPGSESSGTGASNGSTGGSGAPGPAALPRDLLELGVVGLGIGGVVVLLYGSRKRP
jgi:hypothetical protein